MSNVKKVIWPISPTDSQEQADQRLAHFFEQFQITGDVEVQPVYVLSAEFIATMEYFEPIDVSALKSNMAGECERYLKEKFAEVKTQPTVILENHFSTQGAEVALFTEYVDKQKPDFVVLATHGRSGWSRTFLGSFSESFLLKTKVPTITIGPECETIQSLNSALMPVQLSESSQKFVEGFLDDHRLAFVEKLTLFHKISMVDVEEIAWAPALYGLTDFSTGDLLKKAKDSTEKYLNAFKDHPLSQKRLDTKISESLDSVCKVVLEEAKNFDLIVMRTESDSLEANLIGSVTRDVIRQATTPVVVYPHLFKK